MMSLQYVVMKVITVRHVPDDVYEALTRLAERNRRSLQQQALTLLERVRTLEPSRPLERAAAIRRRLAGRDLGNLTQDIQEDRQR